MQYYKCLYVQNFIYYIQIYIMFIYYFQIIIAWIILVSLLNLLNKSVSYFKFQL